MKKKRKLQEDAAAVPSEAEASTKVGKKARKAGKQEAAVAEPVAAAAKRDAVAATQEATPLSKEEKRARKAAKQLAKNKRKKQNKAADKATAAAAAAAAAQTTPKAAVEKSTAVKDDSKEDSLAVFVGGFPFDTTEMTLRRDFQECGEITKCTFPKDAEGKRRGIAYVTFKTKAGQEAACKFDRSDYGGRILMVNKVGKPKKGADKGNGKGQEGKGKSTPKFDHEVSIRGLPWSTTSEQLKKDFQECGEVANFKLLYNEEGKVRGSAFIAFKTEEGFLKALKFNETDYGGRTIFVGKSGEIKDPRGKGKDGKGKGKGKDKGKGQKGKV